MKANAALAGFKLQGKKNSLTREQALGIYEDLKKNFSQYETIAQQKARLNTTATNRAYSAAPKGPPRPEAGSSFMLSDDVESKNTGMWSAFMCVAFFAVAKVTFSFLEYSGVLKVENVSASMVNTNSALSALPVVSNQFSSERIQLLTSLDTRRAELDTRRKKLDDREQDIKKQEQELVARSQELRELTAASKVEREKGEKRKDGQLEQLANVYGAMDPTEAAKLIQQLDVTIALGLLKRMPEKRIGQILSLMSPERALTITKMLSGSNA